MKIFIATPFDSGEFIFSRDFKIPSLQRHKVVIEKFDTKDLITFPEIDKACYAREKLVEEFLKTDYDKLFFLDNDTIISEEDALTLIESYDLVAMGQYVYKREFSSKVQNNRATKRQLIGKGGLGACVIKREVFENLKPPYFRYKDVVVRFKTDAGEDICFCKNLRDNEIPIYIYPLNIGHQDRETHKTYYFNKDRKSVREV